MISLDIFGQNGTYLRTVSSPVDLAQSQAQAGEVAVPCEHIDTVFKYLDAGGLVHRMPDRPTQHHLWNADLMEWEDVRPFDQQKSYKWERAKSERNNQEFGPFAWSGYTFDGDEPAQRRINLATMGAQAALIAGDAAWSVDWTLADNTSLTLSASDMIGVANALGANIAQAHATARAKRQQIEQATTNGELDLI